GESLESSPTNVTPKTQPGKPTDLSANYSDSSVTISWTAPADIGGTAIIAYTVYRDGAYLANQTVGTSFTDNTVTNGVAYSYTVTAWNSEGESLESSPTNVTPKTIPDAPMDLSASYGDSFVNLSWNAPVDTGGATIIAYTIYRDGVYLANQTVGTSYTDNTVSNGISYTYMVTAWNSEGESLESTPTNVIPKAVPDAPTGLSGIYGDSYVILSWTAPLNTGGSALTGYTIYRNGVFLGSQAVGTSYTDNTVSNGISYTYTVTAWNSEGESIESLSIIIIPKTVPGVPTGLSGIDGDSFVILNWTEPADIGGATITAYTIYRDGVFFANQTVGTSFTDNNVTNGISYSYMVTAWNSEGESSQSLAINGKPANVSSNPSNLNATSESFKVTLNWDIPISDGGSSIFEYKIYRSESVNDVFKNTANATGFSYVDFDVMNGITYYYYVSAINQKGESEISNIVTSTPSTISNPPVNLTGIGGDKHAVLSWHSPTSDGGAELNKYNIYRSNQSEGEFLLIGNTTDLIYNDTNLINGITLYYKVSAVNIRGESGFSIEIDVTPKAPVKSTTSSSMNTVSSKTPTSLSTTQVGSSDNNGQFLIIGSLVALVTMFSAGTVYARRRRQ
ncbi:MAG: fibronectin type III domain-containing protein, partial [Candidatus Kariarchaeaceae archaeon]